MGLYLGRTAVLLRGRRKRECLVVGGRRLHAVLIVVSEAAEEGAEDAPAAVLLEAAVRLGDCKRSQRNGSERSAWRNYSWNTNSTISSSSPFKRHSRRNLALSLLSLTSQVARNRKLEELSLATDNKSLTRFLSYFASRTADFLSVTSVGLKNNNNNVLRCMLDGGGRHQFMQSRAQGLK